MGMCDIVEPNSNTCQRKPGAAEESLAKPWKYEGYRSFSRFVASDDDFFFLRRFSTITARVLLSLQDELCQLESQLNAIDDRLAAPEAPDVHNGSFRDESSIHRLLLIKELNEKLRAYNELAIQHSNLRGRPRVVDKDVKSIDAWFKVHGTAIHDDEKGYIQQQEDLFSVAPKSKTPLRALLERSPRFRRLPLWRRSTAYDDQSVIYMSDHRIDSFISLAITFVGLVMLIAPLWILAFVFGTVPRLAIITTFVLVFLCFVSFTTVARPFETLGAAAAYAAVLVVFLQILVP